ncbi:MAG: LacI family DNA-binding transcriptional regulator [Lachnospiraceae bacterium]
MAATLKDVSLLAKVSMSTVSIVLRGNGDIRKISKVTQEKVYDAAQRLNYTTNIQAKALRGGMTSNAVIMLFWATDFRLQILTRFFSGLQTSILNNNYPCEIQIKPYTTDHLEESLDQRVQNTCNGIIVCNPSEKDMVFLESTQISIPTVLYNRFSNKYSTVHMDDATIGQIPAEIFAKHLKKRPAVFRAPATFENMNIRTSTFEKFSKKNGMKTPIVIDVENSMKGGFTGVEKLCSLDPFPDCLFCTSDFIALGALKALHRNNILVPDRIEVISIGNGNPDNVEYSIPSLSVIGLPIEEMAASCLEYVYLNITSFEKNAFSKEFPVHYIARESCGK